MAGELLRGERKYGFNILRGSPSGENDGGVFILAYLERSWGTLGHHTKPVLCSSQRHSLRFERGCCQARPSLARFTAAKQLTSGFPPFACNIDTLAVFVSSTIL